MMMDVVPLSQEVASYLSTVRSLIGVDRVGDLLGLHSAPALVLVLALTGKQTLDKTIFASLKTALNDYQANGDAPSAFVVTWLNSAGGEWSWCVRADPSVTSYIRAEGCLSVFNVR